MKLNNPSYAAPLTEEEFKLKQEAKLLKKIKQEKEKEEKKEEKEKEKEENKRKNSERMKINNPMFNEEVKKKVRKTLNEKIKSGEIKYPKGEANKRFKGTRRIKEYLRLDIKEWRKANLNRANYCCEMCGKTKCYLHVHHLEQFDTIVTRFAEELNIDLKTLEYQSEDYIELSKKIVEYHNNNDIGIVVCQDCHDKIDDNYHKPKKLKGVKNEN